MKFDFLQIFAGNTVTNILDKAGNDGSNYVNSFTGEKVTPAGSNTLDPTLKTFYDTELLENQRVESYYAQFAKKQRLPRNHGTSVEFRKFNTFAPATALKEGVIPTGQQFGMTSLKGAIVQYGTYTTISDKLEMRAFDPVILGATEEMSGSAAETQEMLIRDALMQGTNVLYCDNVKADGTKTASVDAAAMAYNDTAGHAILTPDMVNRAATKLKKDRVPRINGKYVAVIHPSVAYDLRQSDEWIEAHKYAATTELFNGEIGELHGVRFIEDTFAPVCSGTAYDSADKGRTYATFFFGKDAFATIDPEGGNLEMIIHDKDEIGGPLNQFSTIGYKFESNGATILYPERLLRVQSTSYYSATDEANYTAA